jgi:hypothetical protein
METDKTGKVFIDGLSIRHVRKKRIESILGSSIDGFIYCCYLQYVVRNKITFSAIQLRARFFCVGKDLPRVISCSL